MALQYLPLSESSTHPSLGSTSILVVEDDSGDEYFILKAMSALKLETKVVVARDGEEAVDYLFRSGRFSQRRAGENPKVIMLDLCIPKIAGLEVLRLIREDPTTARIPVVIMTSSESNTDIDRCYALGANSVVRKGRFIEEFRESVATAVAYWTRVNVNAS